MIWGWRFINYIIYSFRYINYKLITTITFYYFSVIIRCVCCLNINSFTIQFYELNYNNQIFNYSNFLIHSQSQPGEGHNNVVTCKTEAPAWRNWSPVSAESMPPVARIGKPGIALAMADTALRAMGLMALPANIDHVALVGRSCRMYKYFITGILIYVTGNVLHGNLPWHLSVWW